MKRINLLHSAVTWKFLKPEAIPASTLPGPKLCISHAQSHTSLYSTSLKTVHEPSEDLEIFHLKKRRQDVLAGLNHKRSILRKTGWVHSAELKFILTSAHR